MEKELEKWRGKVGIEYSLLQSMMDPRPEWARRLGLIDYDGLFPRLKLDKKRRRGKKIYYLDNRDIPIEQRKRVSERYQNYMTLLIEEMESK